MQRPLFRFGWILIALAIGCFLFVRSNIRAEHRRQAELAAQMGAPGLAPESIEPSFSELFKFEQMKGGTDILAYAGIALGAGGLLCLLGGLAAGRVKPAPPKTS